MSASGESPPRDSLDREQRGRVAEPGADLAAGLADLLARIREELDYNDAKGAAPYRLGMHDGLRFAEDAVADLLSRHGHATALRATELDA
jgi:hypothetical protein